MRGGSRAGGWRWVTDDEGLGEVAAGVGLGEELGLLAPVAKEAPAGVSWGQGGGLGAGC